MIRVGGATEIEVKERKDRVEDAMNSTRAAVEEGIVPGGGSALLKAVKALDKVNPDNNDQRVGVEIVQRAIIVPVKQIAENAGADGSIIAGKLSENNDKNYGFDAQSGKFVDMIKSGIIDPAKVVRTALQDAASVAGLLITTEAMVAEKPEDKAGDAGWRDVIHYRPGWRYGFNAYREWECIGSACRANRCNPIDIFMRVELRTNLCHSFGLPACGIAAATVR